MQIIETYRNFYKELVEINCPYLKAPVKCTSRGFNHLIYKSDRTRRSQKEIEVRLSSLRYLSEIILCSGTLQEIETLSNGQTFYAFIAIIDSKKYKVVIADSKNGAYVFRSIIPRWKTGKRDTT